MLTTAITIENFSFKYNNSPVFRSLNLQIKYQEKVGLIWANAAGKTSFFSICGILLATEGKIYLGNKLVKKGNFYPEIGLVFQNPDDQLFCPNVRDDIAFGAENLGLAPAEIEHLCDRVPHELSGGEKCMVAISSVLIFATVSN